MLLKKLLRLSLGLCAVAVLAGCSGGGADGSPKGPQISTVYTDVVHYHPSFDQKWGRPEAVVLSFTISVRIRDDLGLSNIDRVYVQRNTAGREWVLFDEDAGVPLDLCYIERDDLFNCQFHDSDSLDTILLDDWELMVVNKQGVTARKSVRFSLPGGQDENGIVRIYGSGYAGDTSSAVPALEAMTIADNDLSFVANGISQSFRIQFTAHDTHAREYAFAFYGPAPFYPYIGRVSNYSPSIASTALVPGQVTEVDLPFSEVVMRDGWSTNDIVGVHIKLFDTLVDWSLVRGALWANHVSFSEFLPLAQP
ncbi:MAG: hypothetical protein R3183_05600 [Oleiphilaceae bacterium]|nr:hypothetical protein [Oleiphilaceae bacterium]